MGHLGDLWWVGQATYRRVLFGGREEADLLGAERGVREGCPSAWGGVMVEAGTDGLGESSYLCLR